MPTPPDSSSAALIEHILNTFHEGHRRDLPALINLARQLPTTGAAPSFADELQALMLDLEAHMFKEEMRLFPMMEQGGNTLIGLLINDMEQEHARHSQHTPQMTARLAALQVPPDHQTTLNALRTGWQAFLDELAQHVAAEDNGLFLMFKTPDTDV